MLKSITGLFESGLTDRVFAHPEDNRVLKSTKLEDLIYKDLRQGRLSLDETEEKGRAKLKSFGDLTRDLFQSFYSVNVSYKEGYQLSTMARKFNRNILEKVVEGDEYPTLKMLTEGRGLESIEAACEFADSVLSDLDRLLKDISGEKDTLKVL